MQCVMWLISIGCLKDLSIFTRAKENLGWGSYILYVHPKLYNHEGKNELSI